MELWNTLKNQCTAGLRVDAVWSTLEPAHEGGREDDFGCTSVTEPPLREGEEASVDVDRGPEDLGNRVRSLGFVLVARRCSRRRLSVMAHDSIPSASRSSFEAVSATVPAG